MYKIIGILLVILIIASLLALMILVVNSNKEDIVTHVESDRLRLTHCVVASDNNPNYYRFWPVVKRAWLEICHIKPVFVLVANSIPHDISQYVDDITLIPPVSGIPTSFQAQCIRLLYPREINTSHDNEAIIISDMDLIPLQSKYYHKALQNVHKSSFVTYRNVLSDYKQYPMCFNAATPRVWRDVFGSESYETTMRRWYGECSQNTWFCDQLKLWSILRHWDSKKAHGETFKRLISLKDEDTKHERLDRGSVTLERMSDKDLDTITKCTDFHMPRPYLEHRTKINSVLDLCLTYQNKLSNNNK
jgi:hypothetical protein